jgi:hypothetical protein
LLPIAMPYFQKRLLKINKPRVAGSDMLHDI